MKDKISSRQYIAIIAMFGLGSVIVSHGSRSAQQDTWWVLLLGFIIAVPQLLMIAYINSKNPGKNIFVIFKETFGKILGYIFSLYFTVSLIILSIFLARIFTEYIRITALTQTPIMLITLLIVVCCAYVSSKNMQSIARLIGLFFIMFIFIFIFHSVLSFLPIDSFENLMPLFHLNTMKTIKYSYENYMNPFYEFYILLIFGGFLYKGKSHYKNIFIATSFVAIILSFNSLRNILILGLPAYRDLYFPTFISNTVLNSGSMIERFELLFTFIFTLCMFAKLILFLKASTIGTKDLLPKVNSLLHLIVLSIIVVILATFLFNDVSHLASIIYSPFRSYMNIGLLLITITTFIFTVYKNKNKRETL